MVDTYKTKKSAQAHRCRILKKFETKLCPIFKEPCLRETCMSFNPGRVYERTQHYAQDAPSKWFVIEPCCSNALVTGYIEMQMVEP